VPFDWPASCAWREQNRPDIIELQIIIEAEQAASLASGKIRRCRRSMALAQYQWKRLNGTMSNGEFLTYPRRQ